MSSTKKIAEFPDVEAKLQKPTKQSAFERQKAEAEAKRKREEAETAAAYQDFVKSFDGDYNEDQGGAFGGSRGPSRQYNNDAPFPQRPGPPGLGASGSGRRHFGLPSGSTSGMKSIPGNLVPPPMSLGRKRTHDGFQSNNRRDREEYGGRLGLDDNESSHLPVSRAFDASDDEEEHTGFGRAEEKAIAKPTLRLANLPPATSPAVIKALIPSNMTVENVKILPPVAPGASERKTIAAIVTLSQETAASDIDAAVSALQNRYLGFGFHLSLHRHLSSAAIAAAAMPNLGSTSTQHPFDAKPVVHQGSATTPHHMGRFAPPPSYGLAGSGPVNRNILHVPTQPLKDIKQLRMIHKVIEGLLEHGPEFEALLMSRPEVQRQEKWAWIWDARSQGGIWYRWRLWEIITGSRSKRGQSKYLPLFEGSHAWKVPEQPLAYEYTTGIDGFISESEYNSSDEEDYEDEPSKLDGGKDPEEVFLNPIEKSKVVHLLARLPTTLGTIRKGDIARITTFALTHASRGADEIVDMIVSNIEKPLAFTSANPDYRKGKNDQDSVPRGDTSAQEDKFTNDSSQDTSAAKLVALYVVSDILSCSSTSGIRHAWRFRQLFEAALRSRKIFEGLGLMAERLNWGRLRAEKWKRSVGLVLSLWEGWCVFPNETQESFVGSFESPPSAKKGEKTDDGEVKRVAGGRWKTVDAAPSTSLKEFAASAFRPETSEAGEGAESDGSYEEYTDDEEGDNELLTHYHIDGESLLDIDIVGLAIEEVGHVGEPVEDNSKNSDEVKASGGFQMLAAPSTSAPSRKRMRAADMFADSDSGGD